MDGSKRLDRLIGEKPIAFVLADEIGKFVVATVDLVCPDEAPLADVYPLIGLVHTFVREGIPVNDILGKDIADRLDAAVLALGFE